MVVELYKVHKLGMNKQIDKSSFNPEGIERQGSMDGYQDNLAQIWNEVMFASSGFNNPRGMEIVYISSSDNSWDEEQDIGLHCWVCQTLSVFWKQYQKHICEHEP